MTLIVMIELTYQNSRYESTLIGVFFNDPQFIRFQFVPVAFNVIGEESDL